MVPTIKPPPQVEDSHVSDSLWTPTETETDSASSPCPVRGIQPTLPMPKVILYSKPPPVKPPPMTPTVQPPPPTKNSNAAPDTKASLDGMVCKLHDLIILIFKIAIPKSKTAKMTSIAINILLLVHELAESICTQLQEHHKVPWVADISRQLDDIKAHLGISCATQPPQKPSYAVALTVGARNAVPGVGPPPPQPPPRPHVTGRFSITLVQKYHDKPAFTGLSNSELIGKILEALQAVDVWLEERPHTPDSEGNVEFEHISPFIRSHWMTQKRRYLGHCGH